MNAHTPGPWLTANAGLLIISATGEPLAQVWEDPPGCENARLMAAAPDLLAALPEALAMCKRQTDFNDDGDGGMFERAAAAITSATGAAS